MSLSFLQVIPQLQIPALTHLYILFLIFRFMKEHRCSNHQQQSIVLHMTHIKLINQLLYTLRNSVLRHSIFIAMSTPMSQLTQKAKHCHLLYATVPEWTRKNCRVIIWQVVYISSSTANGRRVPGKFYSSIDRLIGFGLVYLVSAIVLQKGSWRNNNQKNKGFYYMMTSSTQRCNIT